MILHIPVEDRLNYWCIGYIEKIDGGHHRHYEFFIWMLRRLNYRAVRSYLAYRFIHGPVDFSDGLRAASHTFKPIIALYFSRLVSTIVRNIFSRSFFTSLKIFATSQSFKFLYLSNNLALFKFASLWIIESFAS